MNLSYSIVPIFNLHGELVAGVATSVDDIEAGHGHEDVLHLTKIKHEDMRELGSFYPSKVGDVTVKRNTLVSCAGLKINDDNVFIFILVLTH